MWVDLSIMESCVEIPKEIGTRPTVGPGHPSSGHKARGDEVGGKKTLTLLISLHVTTTPKMEGDTACLLADKWLKKIL